LHDGDAGLALAVEAHAKRALARDTGGLGRFDDVSGIPLACAAEPPVEAHAAGREFERSVVDEAHVAKPFAQAAC
jgi:hypothetical protein